MATHSSVLAWRIPGTAEPGGLPSMGSHRVGHDWRDLAAAAAAVCFQKPNLCWKVWEPWSAFRLSPTLLTVRIVGNQVYRSLVHPSALVWESCHNKTQRTVWLKSQKFLFSQIWRVAVQDQRASDAALLWGLQARLPICCGSVWTAGAPGVSACPDTLLLRTPVSLLFAVVVWSPSLTRLFATQCTVARQAPPSMGFSRQEHWSGLPFPPPGIFLTQDRTRVSCTGRQILYHWATRDAQLVLYINPKKFLQQMTRMPAKHKGSLATPNMGLEPRLLLGSTYCTLVYSPSSTCRPESLPTGPSGKTAFTNPCKFFSAQMLNPLYFSCLRGDALPQYPCCYLALRVVSSLWEPNVNHLQ